LGYTWGLRRSGVDQWRCDVRQRGRKSIARVIALNARPEPPRLTVPEILTESEAKIFTEVVGSADPRHFTKDDLPILIAFARATARADVLCVKDEDMPLWLSVTRVQMSLAMKLRLTPSTRMRDKRNAAPLAPLPRPWETRDAAS